MKQLFYGTLFILLLLAGKANAQGSQSKLLTKIGGLPYQQEVNFQYDKSAKLVGFVVKYANYDDVYKLKYDKQGRLIERKLDSENGSIKIDFYYAYQPGKIVFTIKTGGRIQEKSTKTIDYPIGEDGRLYKEYSGNNFLEKEFEYDANGNIAKIIQYYANNSTLTTEYEYSENLTPFASLADIPAWLWAYNFATKTWADGLWGKNLPTKVKTVKANADGSKKEEIFELKYEFDADGYPTKQYMNGKVVKEFFYQARK